MSSAFIPPFTQIADPNRPEPTMIESGNGIFITDADGQTMIDAWSGMVCVGLGYGRDEIVDALTKQVKKLSYSHSLYDTTNQLAIDLSNRLVEISPPGLDHVFLSMSGSDAADTVLKVIRYHNNVTGHPMKKHVIALERAYHGASSVVAGLTQFPECNDNFDVPLPHQHHIPSPWHLGVHSGASENEVIERSVDALRSKVMQVGPDLVAAFIAEPVMITAGVIVPPLGWLGAMADTCRELGIWFIADEVVTGFGRTGRVFSCEWDGVQPDMMFLGKGITSGYIPQGASLISGDIFDGITNAIDPETVFGHGFTHSGHPPSCAVTLTCIDLYEDLVTESERLGSHLLSRLNELCESELWVSRARGRGLAAGIDVADPDGNPLPSELNVSSRIRAEARRRGLMTRAFDGDMFGFAPPLIITEDEIDQMVSIFADVVGAVRRGEDEA